MYEVTYFGWTRTPDELKKLKDNKWYRFKTNWLFFKEGIKYLFRWWDWDLRELKHLFIGLFRNFKNLFLNRNNF